MNAASAATVQCMPDSAEALRVRVRAGDTDAFGELVALHEARVLRIAWRILGDRDEAYDAAQDTFLRVWRARRRLDPARDPAPWLARIAVNVCRTRLRRRRAHRFDRLDDDVAGQLASDESAQAAARGLAAHDARRIVRAALAELTDKERAAVTLRDLEELSTDEVASALRCTVGTVRSHLSRGRAKLAAALAGLKGNV